MSEVVSTISQLIKAYKAHKKYATVDKQDISHYLLLFYSLECGLKAHYLRSNYLHNTSQLKENFGSRNQYGHGHDLMEWAKALKLLKLPNKGYVDKPATPVEQMHQRLRYGVFGNTAYEKEQIKFLNQTLSLLKDKL